MTHFIVRRLVAVAAGLVAVGLSPAGLAFAAGDAEGAAPTAESSAVVTTSAATTDRREALPAPAGHCRLVWVNIFGPVCMPGR